jgi:hypothetical protein
MDSFPLEKIEWFRLRARGKCRFKLQYRRHFMFHSHTLPINEVRVMEINRKAPLVAQKQIFIEAPPQTVWNIQTDINNWSTWQPDITASKLDSHLTVGSIFRWKLGGLNVASTIQVIEPSREIGWTGRALDARAKHVWKLAPQDNGTLVTTEESWRDGRSDY